MLDSYFVCIKCNLLYPDSVVVNLFKIVQLPSVQCFKTVFQIQSLFFCMRTNTGAGIFLA